MYKQQHYPFQSVQAALSPNKPKGIIICTKRRELHHPDHKREHLENEKSSIKISKQNSSWKTYKIKQREQIHCKGHIVAGVVDFEIIWRQITALKQVDYITLQCLP